MRPLSTVELFGVWEQGLPRTPVQRSLLLLAAAWPEMTPQDAARLSIGQRDAYLLTLREWIFGPRLSSLVICPDCGERLEFAFQVADIRVTTTSDLPDDLTVNVAAYRVQYRLLNSLDLLALVHSHSTDEARRQLLEHCICQAKYQGEMLPVEQLPAEVIEAVEAEMARFDPQADVQLELTCPACQHAWTAPFDIGSFFWQEINAWAYRLLREIHLLASAYGWREADILAMSSWKRQLYLQMVHG